MLLRALSPLPVPCAIRSVSVGVGAYAVSAVQSSLDCGSILALLV